MLGYEDVLNANPGTLSTAAAKWREMAQKFHTMEGNFDRDVLSVTRNGLWTGGTAGLANFQLMATKEQIAAAQVEANAMASLLDDARADFEAAQKQVREAADGAVKAGFKVTGTGVAVLDPSTLDKGTLNDLHHDADTQRAYQEAAGKWTQAIEAGIQRATDADQRAARALRSASKAGSIDNTFNGKALGGGDAADAQRAADLATRIDSLNDDERAQLANLMRADADSPQFSQTLLDRLGPEKTLDLAEKLNNPGKDGGRKAAYPGLQTDLTRAIASATQDPNTEFYRKWREGLKENGTKNFGSNTEPVYGYQILGTLMSKGDAKYSTPFLTDLADDITASEKKHPGLWSYKASHDGTSLGADPLDEVLGVMGRQPEAATSYLDPGSDGGNKRLHFLLKERDWPQGYITGYTGMIRADDPLSQSGLAAAIEAASTGERAGTAHDGKHTEAQARIMHDTIVTMDEDHGGDKIKATLRQPLANALADYVGDTHELLNGRNDVYNGHTGHDSVWKDGDTVRMAVGQDSLVRFMRGLSDDPAAYGTLHRAETGRIDQELAAIGPHPTEAQMKDPMGKGAAALGVFDAIRADTAMDLRDDKNAEADWKAKVLYHTIGAPITPIAPLGDAAQRLVDTWTYAVSLEEKDQNNSEANAKVSDTYLGANRQMSDMIGIWARDRGMDPDSPDINSLQDDMLNSRNRSNDVAGRYLGRGNA
ncbi:DUF6571 family protein [Kitasatospora sp. A2-31]|uniref:DUF6571 family protein n=1 Tax=Kitasatospora sp. A2-31 TaxID=2916414 RepID=UPI001EEE5FE8|nr:DUF6571 family protein [Kitasatospora sp. A2-31]MCG6498821.1 hypothetical protein [Kitasatospora sp. A2-31]